MEYGWNLGLKVSFMIHTYLTKKTVKIDSIFKLKKLANGKRIQKVLSIALLLYRESFWFWKSKQETPKSIPPYLFAKSLATSLPIPEVAPVTRATFPSKILGLSEPLVGHFKGQEISEVIFVGLSQRVKSCLVLLQVPKCFVPVQIIFRAAQKHFVLVQ